MISFPFNCNHKKAASHILGVLKMTPPFERLGGCELKYILAGVAPARGGTKNNPPFKIVMGGLFMPPTSRGGEALKLRKASGGTLMLLSMGHLSG